MRPTASSAFLCFHSVSHIPSPSLIFPLKLASSWLSHSLWPQRKAPLLFTLWSNKQKQTNKKPHTGQRKTKHKQGTMIIIFKNKCMWRNDKALNAYDMPAFRSFVSVCWLPFEEFGPVLSLSMLWNSLPPPDFFPWIDDANPFFQKCSFSNPHLISLKLPNWLKWPLRVVEGEISTAMVSLTRFFLIFLRNTMSHGCWAVSLCPESSKGEKTQAKLFMLF